MPPTNTTTTKDNNNNKDSLSLCDYKDASKRLWVVLRRLKRLFQRYGYVPVILLGQTRGMPSQNECDEYWNGKQCQEGYYKHFFAQTYEFGDGSCLKVPPYCDGEL